MKLLIAIIQDQDSLKLADELVAGGYRSTKLASTGGFLRTGSTTLLIGVQDEQVEDVMSIIKRVCQAREKMIMPIANADGMPGFVMAPISVTVGGAVIFVVNVDQFCQLTKPDSTVCERE